MLFIIFFIFLSLGTTSEISQEPQYILEDDFKQQSFVVDKNYETD